jgi:hypothetical protein
MPLDDEVRLADRLVEVERAMLAELYDRLALAGFSDLSVEMTAVFKDIAPDGTALADLAGRAQLTDEQARHAVEHARDHGYVALEDDVARLTERGWAAVAAGRRALREIEASWEQHLGAERFRAFADAIEELAAWQRGEVRDGY